MINELDYPKIVIIGCESCSHVCRNNDGKVYFEDYIEDHLLFGRYDTLKNIVELTPCAGRSAFKEIINIVNHEYLHWVMNKVFPERTYLIKENSQWNREYLYSKIIDMKFWSEIEISLGQWYIRKRQWLPSQVNVWEGFIVSAINMMNLVDARLWFK